MKLCQTLVGIVSLACISAWGQTNNTHVTQRANQAKPTPVQRQSIHSEPAQQQDHVLRRPGEIIFRTGAVIEGKVEKPQVIIVFPKEKPKPDSLSFDHSFRENMLKPLDVKGFKAIKTR